MPARPSVLALVLVLAARPIEAQHPYPPNKSVPATPCKGGGDCDSGKPVCRPTRQDPTPLGTVVVSDSGYSVTSDRGGPYVGGTSNVRAAASNAAYLGFGLPPEGVKGPMRRINVDLRRPVPNGGAVPLGIITDSLWVDMNAQWYTEKNFTTHSLLDIAVGQKVNAEQLNVGFAINGIAHALQMGPQPWGHCFSNGTAIHGDGTTRATITRVDPLTWVVDLPPGSIGRLWDVHLHDPHAVDRGLYYVSLHYAVHRHQAAPPPY